MMKPLLLLILDGFGIAEPSNNNAISQANMPNYDSLWQQFPHTQLEASGRVVGLPDGQMGNSEVGHLSIGAGRTVKQTLLEINDIIASNQLENQPALAKALHDASLKPDGRLQLIGLVSDGGVHSDINHLKALIKLAKAAKISQVFVHVITDGRDTDPRSGLEFAQELDLFMLEQKIGKIASVSGRYYAMDRDQRWDRTELAYQAIVDGEGEAFTTAEQAIEASYNQNVTDEFIKPAVIDPSGKLAATDTVICFNFRPDRMIQLTQSLTASQFDYFKRPISKFNLLTMTEYQPNLNAKVIFPKTSVKQTLGEILAEHQLKQHRVAETEKYAHVTYFLNGGQHNPFTGEKRTLIESPKVATYDLQPEMSVQGVSQVIIDDLSAGESQVIIANFANPDMVGHTGNIPATIAALEAVDTELGRVVSALTQHDGTMILIADHGNAEAMRSDDDQPLTAHTTNPVPCIVTRADIKLRPRGSLIDVAPTILDLLNLEQPKLMTGRSLIQ